MLNTSFKSVTLTENQWLATMYKLFNTNILSYLSANNAHLQCYLTISPYYLHVYYFMKTGIHVCTKIYLVGIVTSF